MSLVTCAFSPPAIHAMASGCWREWHFRNRRNAHRRTSEIRKISNLEAKPVSNVHRKHPLSVAISMALLAAAATSAMASERTSAPAENAGAQDPAQQDAPTMPSPDVKKPKSGTGSAGSEAAAKEA